MRAVFMIVLVLHYLGFAGIVGGYAMALQRQVINPIMLWAARVQFILGLALVGISQMGGTDTPPNNAWVGVKFVIALAVVACCEIANAKAARGENKPVLLHVAVGLAILNFLVAMTWH